MNKVVSCIIIAIVVICGIVFIKNYFDKDVQEINKESNYENKEDKKIVESEYKAERTGSVEKNEVKNQSEIEIAQFSTKIYSKDSERQNNIAITCKTISEKKVEPGETFSFCQTVGKATKEKGYQEADIYVKGEKKKGLGGGNCQVSTTLYNAVKKIPEFEIIERHQHSGKVPYISDGQDAAVAYGTYDFRFKNNMSNCIKIVMECNQQNIKAQIYKIE